MARSYQQLSLEERIRVQVETERGLSTHPITAVFQPWTSGTTTTSSVLEQGITGTAVVQVTGSSGALSHNINLSYLSQ